MGWRVGTRVQPSRSGRHARPRAELGINLIDTAECYGDHTSERLIGDYLAAGIATAGSWPPSSGIATTFHGSLVHLSPSEVATQLEASLRALRTDTIDLYQFHSGSDEAFRQPELWAMLQRLKQAGQVGHLGVSIASKGSSAQAQEAPDAGIEVLQLYYNRLERKAETLWFPWADKFGLGVLGACRWPADCSRQIQDRRNFRAERCTLDFDAERTAGSWSRLTRFAARKCARRADGAVGVGLVPPEFPRERRDSRLQNRRAS